MRFEELVILLPCHSFEDFPIYHTGDDAEGLLAAYTSLWHPALLASAEKLPTWFRADAPPEQVSNRLVVIPQVSDSLLLTGWPARAKNEGACVVRKKTKRAEILAAALAEFDGPEKNVDPDLAADFLALGFAFLQSELLVRQLRQYSNLDEIHLRGEAVAGAKAACAGDADEARRRLRSCFELMQESRERAYPAEAFLLDLTLVADTTLGAELERELLTGRPQNLLLSAGLVAKLAETSPTTFALLKNGLAAETLDFIGGETEERELPLLPPESLLWGLLDGAALYKTHLGRLPCAFGRRRFGLTPWLPGALAKAGYEAAVHFTLDDGQFPAAHQSRIRWEGPDGSLLETLAKVPLEAETPATFLNLPEKAAATMDTDQVATLVFAHWPGRACDYYEDLRRASGYAPIFGKFVTLGEYLKTSSLPGDVTRFEPDEYRSPFLKQAIIRRRNGPLQASADHFRRRLAWDAGNAYAHWAELFAPAAAAELRSRGPALQAEVEAASGPFRDAAAESLTPRIEEFRDAAATALARALPPAASGAGPGMLLLNPLSCSRRAYVFLPEWKERPPLDNTIRAAQTTSGGIRAVVDLPAMGYVWIPRPKVSAAEKKLPTPLADAQFVRNEFFEAAVDRKTGGVRSLHDYERRSNRLSQQLAIRLPGRKPKAGDVWRDPDEDAAYTAMTADSTIVTSVGPVLGETVSKGRLVDPDGKVLARYEQKTQAWLGSRVMVLEIALELLEPLKADPWNSYFACRIAWNDDSADLHSSVGGFRSKTSAKRIESPLFVEAAGVHTKTLILVDGQPYHRKIGYRTLDVLLAAKGDTRLNFRVGIGVDVENPFPAALAFSSPAAAVPLPAGPPTPGASSWFFHLDRKTVTATGWETLRAADGPPHGMRVRLQNTEPREVEAKLRFPHDPREARFTDWQGKTLRKLEIEGDAVRCKLEPCEFIQLEAEW